MTTLTNKQRELNIRKKQFLNNNGYNLKLDGSWGPWLEEQYNKATTKDKHYNTTPLGILSYLYDKTLGEGTTYQKDPSIITGNTGEIKEDNRTAFRRNLDYYAKRTDNPLGYTIQNIIPTGAVAAAITSFPLVTSAIKVASRNPKTLITGAKNLAKNAVSGLIGMEAVNATSKAATGKTWGEQIAQTAGVSPDLGEVTNPGMLAGYPVNIVSRNYKYYFPKAKLYSDNSIVNAYATLARRYDLPDKARLPYLIRRISSNKLNINNEGNIVLNGERFNHTNFTYDRPVVSHSSGKWDNAQQTLLINPRTLVKENKFGSIEPSDMFTIKDPDIGLTVSPSDVINITANPTASRISSNNGIQTFSSTPLKKQELKQLQSEHQAYINNFGKRFKFAKGDRDNSNKDYWEAVFNIQQKFGRPKVKDVRLLESITGLKSGIQDINVIPKFRELDYNKIRSTSINDIDKIINNLPKFGNNRKFEWMKRNDYDGVQYPYKNFFYDPATPAESEFVFPLN